MEATQARKRDDKAIRKDSSTINPELKEGDKKEERKLDVMDFVL